jgi:hypothetical protein
LFISILSGAGVIKSEADSKNLQNFLICLEMLPAAIFMQWAFPYTDYKGTGPRTGLDVHNVTHAISVRDLVSDTVHQFAPTYHNYVLYSNSGAKNAPKMQKPKPQLAKEVQERVKQYNYQDNANLLANMELGVHREEYERTTSDQDEASPHKFQRSDSPALRREPTFTDADDIFREGPLEEDEEGVEVSSASVHGHMVSDDGDKPRSKSKSKVLMRQTTDDFNGPDTSLEMDDMGQGSSLDVPKKSYEERKREFLGRGWSDVALDDER